VHAANEKKTGAPNLGVLGERPLNRRAGPRIQQKTQKISRKTKCGKTKEAREDTKTGV